MTHMYPTVDYNYNHAGESTLFVTVTVIYAVKINPDKVILAQN